MSKKIMSDRIPLFGFPKGPFAAPNRPGKPRSNPPSPVSRGRTWCSGSPWGFGNLDIPVPSGGRLDLARACGMARRMEGVQRRSTGWCPPVMWMLVYIAIEFFLFISSLPLLRGRTQNVSYMFQGVFEGGPGGPWKCKLTFWRYFDNSPH